MKVLRRVCRHCGAIAFFSVEIICQPGTSDRFGEYCPHCRTTEAIPQFLATEIDMPEVGEPIDIDAVRKSIEREMKSH